jgi:hypothetical protein
VNRKESGIIKKIQYGLDLNNPNLTIQVGTVIKAKPGYAISEIIEDKNTFVEYGYFEYLIFIAKASEQKQEERDSLFWKRFLKKPDMIEYFFQDEIEELLY